MGTETIIEKIKQKSAEETAAILRAGEEQAAAAEAEILDKADRRIQKLTENGEKEAGSLRLREELNASLQARKNTLSAKRRLLDEAFEQALDRLCALDGAEWEALMNRLVDENGMPGKVTIHAAAKDIERIKATMLVKWSASLTMKHGSPCLLTLSKEPASFRGGLLFEGSRYDVDASFESLLRDIREESEQEVAAILFGSEGKAV